MSQPHIERDEKEAVLEVLGSGILAQGPKVEKFEKEFAKYTDVKYAIAVNSGTAALHTTLIASGIKKDDEIITTPFTFISTANSILFAGAKPVFADIREDDFNINPEEIKEKITKKTKAILPVHLFGQPAEMGTIMEIADDYGLQVIEDACQAHGAEFDGKKVGPFGIGCFSFYPTKNMTTGEGGIITTNDKETTKKAKMIRSHGQKERYIHEILGYNYRMTDIAASIGICQLKKLDQFINKRIENAESLTKEIKKINGLIPPYIMPDVKHVFNQYTLRVTDDFGLSRDELREKLHEKGIETGVYYPTPIHKQPIYKEMGNTDSLPISEKAAKEVISLPVHPSLTKKDLKHLKEVVSHI